MKNFFLLLSLIILGLDSVKSNNFDIFLTLVLDELYKLWIGVQGLDVMQPVGGWLFTLRVILMWTIHNFPGYGIVSGCQHQGYKACPPCGRAIVSRWSKELGKPMFKRSQQWLWRNHPYWLHPNIKHFNGKKEVRQRPYTTTTTKIIWQAWKTEKWVAIGNTFNFVYNALFGGAHVPIAIQMGCCVYEHPN
jgi:hypothetical protein